MFASKTLVLGAIGVAVVLSMLLVRVTVEGKVPAPALQVEGIGTAGQLARFTDSGTLGDSALYESGGDIGLGTTSPNGDLEIAKNNNGTALLLTHPDSIDPVYDNSPLAALKIQAPLTGTTRHFVSGIWVETNGADIDDGRGIMVVNTGKSDSIYVQQDGADGTGFAALSNAANTTGFVSETGDPEATAAVVRQGPGGGQSNLLSVVANVAGSAEMVRFNSDQTGKVGLMFRMAGSGNKAIVVKDEAEDNVFVVDSDTGQLLTQGNILTGASIGVGTTNPQSSLQVVGGYIQFPTISGGPPPLSDCDQASESGRAVVRTDGSTNFYVCTGAGGWTGEANGFVSDCDQALESGGAAAPTDGSTNFYACTATSGSGGVASGSAGGITGFADFPGIGSIASALSGVGFGVALVASMLAGVVWFAGQRQARSIA